MYAGGLSQQQMAFNNPFHPFNGGFSSRPRHMKHPLPHDRKTDESPYDNTDSRISRSHLLAGLRTAPKSPMPHQNHGFSNNNRAVPQAAAIPQHTTFHQPVYTLPEQVLAPPSIDVVGGDGPVDDPLYAELMSTNLYLAAQQQRLQQQLTNVTAAAQQQFQGLSLGNHVAMPPNNQPDFPSDGQDYAQPVEQQLLQLQLQLQMRQQQQQINSVFPSGPSMSFYQQQLQQGVQPVVEPVLGHPGLFSVYNPLTGQQNYFFDNTEDQEYVPDGGGLQFPNFQTSAAASPLPLTGSPSLRTGTQSPVLTGRSISPLDVAPLPPPSTNAFRRGGGGQHRRNLTMDTSRANSNNSTTIGSGLGSGRPAAAMPPTPLTGTFGPGQNRAGEHPIRQPRGPPSLEDLLAKPTSKIEGSKNFAARQRRRAVHSLVRAGIERRGETTTTTRSNHSGSSSGGSSTPSSEKEFAFSSDGGSGGGGDWRRSSASLSSKPSLGSLRAAANGAIGSERKEKWTRERNSDSPDSAYGSYSTSSSPGVGEDQGGVGGMMCKFADFGLERVSSPMAVGSSTSTPPAPVAAVVAGQQKTVSQSHGGVEERRRRTTPMLILSSAEKRKSMVM